MTRLTCYFFDSKGTSLASPATTEHADELVAYQTALAFRDAVQAQRGVKVYLQVVEVA